MSADHWGQIFERGVKDPDSAANEQVRATEE